MDSFTQSATNDTMTALVKRAATLVGIVSVLVVWLVTISVIKFVNLHNFSYVLTDLHLYSESVLCII